MTADEQLEGFIAKYAEATAAMARAALARMRELLPGAVSAVYDNYNALAVGFGPTERASQIVFSLAVYPRWVSLFFAQGARLDDPHGLLKGQGSQVRHIVLSDLALLDDPRVRALMDAALAASPEPLDPGQPHRTVIKSVLARQRPRR